MVSFGVCIQGFVYNLLNQNPVFRFDQDAYGKMFVSEYFMRGMRQQYAGEGYIISALVCGFGLVVLGMVKADTLFTTRTEKRVAVGVGIVACFCLL
jgi:hypothetical protein